MGLTDTLETLAEHRGEISLVAGIGLELITLGTKFARRALENAPPSLAEIEAELAALQARMADEKRLLDDSIARREAEEAATGEPA